LDTAKTLFSVNGITATPSTQVGPGDVLGYDIVVTNTGGSAGTTTLTETVPAHTTFTGAAVEGWSCPTGSAAGTSCPDAVSVAAGFSVTASFSVTVASPLPAGTVAIANTVDSSTGACSTCSVDTPITETVKTPLPNGPTSPAPLAPPAPITNLSLPVTG
jgi:uncharacterized repeat protein (TIGR01451 family)